ncbi:MAG: hypothetical protein WCH58_00635 [Candidatus Saccharibacteria bacterium]
MNNKKKLIIFALVLIVIVSVVAIGSVFIIKSTNKNGADQIQSNATKASTDAIKTSAAKVISSDPVSARALLEKARQQYLDLKDTNDVVDVDALIYQIDHADKK